MKKTPTHDSLSSKRASRLLARVAHLLLACFLYFLLFVANFSSPYVRDAFRESKMAIALRSISEFTPSSETRKAIKELASDQKAMDRYQETLTSLALHDSDSLVRSAASDKLGEMWQGKSEKSPSELLDSLREERLDTLLRRFENGDPRCTTSELMLVANTFRDSRLHENKLQVWDVVDALGRAERVRRISPRSPKSKFRVVFSELFCRDYIEYYNWGSSPDSALELKARAQTALEQFGEDGALVAAILLRSRYLETVSYGDFKETCDSLLLFGEYADGALAPLVRLTESAERKSRRDRRFQNGFKLREVARTIARIGRKDQNMLEMHIDKSTIQPGGPVEREIRNHLAVEEV